MKHTQKSYKLKGHKLYNGESVFTAEFLLNQPEDAIRKATSEPLRRLTRLTFKNTIPFMIYDNATFINENVANIDQENATNKESVKKLYSKNICRETKRNNIIIYHCEEN